MMQSTVLKFFYSFFLIGLLSTITYAQNISKQELFNTLKSGDSVLFETGFNQCNLIAIATMLSNDFEFYHDKDGALNSKADFINTLKRNLCSTGENILRRTLDEQSLEVFTLYDQEKLYGAMQTGRHSFGNSIARFTNLWILEGNRWVLSRIISYDHQLTEPAKITDVVFIKLPAEALLKYLGNYQFSPDFTLSIILESGKIYGDAQGQKAQIKPLGNHQFLDNDQVMQLKFIMNEEGLATGLVMNGPEGKMIAQKIK